MSARAAILARLARVRRDDTPIETSLALPLRGPGPAPNGDRVARFEQCAQRLASTVARVACAQDVPTEVARYLASLDLPPRLVCWVEWQGLDWAGAGVQALCRPAAATDLIGLTGAFAGIAETGTLMLISGETTPATTSLLPETHIAVLASSRLVDTLEDAFALLRREAARWPRAVNLISGPSRTADIEQTVTLGAHGPYRVHIILVDH
ncbi:LutC/YkgG family protein [Thiobacter aerophilum]|uniref:Lactate utilization protein C n=1 Tax=Thiobacter aerophilum TaxID=3121275 RepID=A0ABV0EFM4_9BURK